MDEDVSSERAGSAGGRDGARGAADGVILLAHGSKSESWKEPFEKLLIRLRAKGAHPHLRLAYMEFAGPSLEACLDELRGDDCKHIEVLPLFIAAGKHLSRDIPERIERYRSRRPGMHIELHPPLGESEAFIDLLGDYLSERIGHR